MREAPAESNRCSPGWDASKQHPLTCGGKSGEMAVGVPQTIFLCLREILKS